MIDVNQLTSLISAFRVETEKESISPETVGKILQDITDLLRLPYSLKNVNNRNTWNR